MSTNEVLKNTETGPDKFLCKPSHLKREWLLHLHNRFRAINYAASQNRIIWPALHDSSFCFQLRPSIHIYRFCLIVFFVEGFGALINYEKTNFMSMALMCIITTQSWDLILCSWNSTTLVHWSHNHTCTLITGHMGSACIEMQSWTLLLNYSAKAAPECGSMHYTCRVGYLGSKWSYSTSSNACMICLLHWYLLIAHAW